MFVIFQVEEARPHQIFQQANHQPLSPSHRQITSLSQGPTTPNNNQYMMPTSKSNPSNLRLESLVLNGPGSPPPQSPHQQFNGYLTSQSSNYYHHDHNKFQGNPQTHHQESNVNSRPPMSPIQSGAQRLDSLLLTSGSPQVNNLNERVSLPPQPPERGSSFTVMSQTQGVLRNSTSNMLSLGSEKNSVIHGRGSESNTATTTPTATTTTTTKRVSFHDPNANQPPPQPPAMEQIREDPNVSLIT